MALNNPAFSHSPVFKDKKDMTPEQLQELYDMSSPNTVAEPTMTVQDSIVKSVISFVVLLVGAAIGWFIVAANPELAVGVFLIAGIGAFVLALVNIFKREPSPALILLYALLEGALVGGLSSMYNQLWDGIVIQAVVGTLAVVGITLALFASGKIRASKRATKIWFIAMFGYIGLTIVNMILMLTGVVKNPWGIDGIEVFGIPLGVVIGVLVVIMAAYSLVLDFDMIQRGVQNGAPAKFGWTGAFSIMVTVVWLYLEILRILAIARN